MFLKKDNAPNHHIDCLINTDTLINGDIVFNGGLRIDGNVKGNITTHEGRGGTLIISQQAKVEGQITVTHAVINGEVKGNIKTTDFLQLEAHARVSGDITYNTLEMHHGAVVSGKLTHSPHAPEEMKALPFREEAKPVVKAPKAS